MKCVNRPNTDQVSRERIEDLGLIEVDVLIKRQRSNKEEQGRKK